MSMKRVDVKIGFLCNNNCRFCVQAHRKKHGNRSFSQIKGDLEESRKSCDSVVFTGGEPTIHPNILELVAYARDLGYKVIQIQSNGRRFSYLDFCEKMIEAGATEFGPALHGHRRQLHNFLTRSPGSFDQTVQGIRNLKELGQRVMTNTVVVKPNYRYLAEIASLLVSLGVDQYQLAFVHPIGNAYANYDSIVPCVSLASPCIHQALQVGIDAGVRVMAEAMPYCMMACYEDYGSEKIIPPTEIREIDFDPDYETTRKSFGKLKFSQCVSCKFDSVCEGPWKEYPEKRGSEEFVAVTG